MSRIMGIMSPVAHDAAARASHAQDLHVPAAALLQARWAGELTEELRRRVLVETSIRTIPAGDSVCHKGETPDYWIGVLRGLVKIVTASPEGRSISFIGVPSGGWF